MRLGSLEATPLLPFRSSLRPPPAGNLPDGLSLCVWARRDAGLTWPLCTWPELLGRGVSNPGPTPNAHPPHLGSWTLTCPADSLGLGDALTAQLGSGPRDHREARDWLEGCEARQWLGGLGSCLLPPDPGLSVGIFISFPPIWHPGISEPAHSRAGDTCPEHRGTGIRTLP